ncbi:MAG: hypothetical protein Q9225_005290 [Loekoesia sp. 1 TL-2023]
MASSIHSTPIRASDFSKPSIRSSTIASDPSGPLNSQPKIPNQYLQTRITTKYRISPPPSPRKRKAATASQSDSAATTPNPPPTQQQAATSRAHLVLKTYDPVSGACLKYKTDKAAEVGRLVSALGKCGKVMSGLPLEEDVDTEGGGVELKEVKEEVTEQKPAVSGKEGGKSPAQGQGQGKGGGGGGKKKKGKR